jgi:glycosyltransferase involved in cell wall biosynthesis
MKERIAQAGLAARVEWTPNLTREQKIAFLRSLTIFSVPAIYVEAFGLYVLEAMACGIPVVQPDAAAFPEIVTETGSGRCVPPGDPAALARAWQALLADPAARARMGHAGRSSVEQLFSARTMAERFGHIAARFVHATA